MTKNDSLRPTKLVTLADGVMPQRVVERTQGCWNCVHRQTPEAVRKQFTAQTGLQPGENLHRKILKRLHSDPVGFNKALRDVMKAQGGSELEAANFLVKQAEQTAAKEAKGILFLSQLVLQDKVTLCTIDHNSPKMTPGAFLPMTFLCGDSSGTQCHWKGMSGAAEARAPGEGPAKPMDEVYDDVNFAASKRPALDDSTKRKPQSDDAA